MIFAPDMIPLIRARRKTQTRRPVVGKLACRYKPGRRYRVQPGRGKPGVLEVTVLDVRCEWLGQIDQRDARREGFGFVAQFRERWEQLHGSWDPELEVWVISFAVGDLRDRFDQPRLLARSPGRAGETADAHQDYVTEPRLAMAGSSDPGEGLTDAQLKPIIEQAHRRDEARRRNMKAEQPRVRRLAAIERAAEQGDQHAKRHLHVIDQRIAAAEQKRARDAERAA